jgi:hypothetical protein
MAGGVEGALHAHLPTPFHFSYHHILYNVADTIPTPYFISNPICTLCCALCIMYCVQCTAAPLNVILKNTLGVRPRLSASSRPVSTPGPALRSGHTVKKRLAIFPSPAGMSLTKLSLAGNRLFPARKSLISEIPAGVGKFAKLFLQC